METEIPRSWAPGGKQAHGPVLVVVGGLHGNEPSGVIALTRPRAHQVRHRHPIQPRDQFRMEPDLVNFQSVRKNQLLASDQNGEIRSPRPGRILMPSIRLRETMGSSSWIPSRRRQPTQRLSDSRARNLGPRTQNPISDPADSARQSNRATQSGRDWRCSEYCRTR